MKILIIHHVQAMWNESLQRFGTSIDKMIEEVYDHIEEINYDRVIVTNFEGYGDLEDEQKMLEKFGPEVYDYMYGWGKEEVDDWGFVEGKDYCQGGDHSEVVLIPDWMKELEGEVYLCGAFDGECIEDMEIALEGAGHFVKRVDSLIV